MTPEGKFQDAVQTYLNARKILNFRTQMGWLSGLPDIIAIYKGYFIGIELKRPDKKGVASGQQEYIIDIIRKAGAIAGIVESMEDLENLLEEAEQR